MKERRFGDTRVTILDDDAWYVVVTPPYAAVCNCHGVPHLHRHPVRAHAEHRPRIPLDPSLTLRETLRRLSAYCSPLDRGLEFDELLELLE